MGACVWAHPIDTRIFDPDSSPVRIRARGRPGRSPPPVQRSELTLRHHTTGPQRHHRPPLLKYLSNAPQLPPHPKGLKRMDDTELLLQACCMQSTPRMCFQRCGSIHLPYRTPVFSPPNAEYSVHKIFKNSDARPFF